MIGSKRNLHLKRPVVGRPAFDPWPLLLSALELFGAAWMSWVTLSPNAYLTVETTHVRIDRD
ncbi:hypothetical protein [Limnoglobus roseus]|uniref:Uncharacterized protein n=1 Tax=Limnoglobus roseus TaxID=2598579 RepID=A0A5C1AUW1_9BACT|nr:hypothetical protein [Limnoglobus roseus]QEL20588.1 hypothetical protein PX52LOC_07693 [Limnoglobus roseus]